MATIPEHRVRRMTKDDIPEVLSIWKETGMYQGTDSLKTWFQIDPEGMFVAATEDGHILGSCSAIFSRDDLAFLGLYAVRPEYRGRGVGGSILKEALDYVGDRNCALNSNESHLATYRDRAGFEVVTDWVGVAYENTGVDIDCFRDKIPGIVVADLEDRWIDELVEYDAVVHGHCREKLLKLTFLEKDLLALVALKDEGKTLSGYGIIRKNVHGHGMIGPLYADDKDSAEALMSQLLKRFPACRDHGVITIPLKNNPDSIDFALKLGLGVFDVVNRLYKTKAVPADFKKIWAHHDLNFCNF